MRSGAVFASASLRDLVAATASFDEFNARVVKQHLLLARVLHSTLLLQLRAVRPSKLFTANHRAMLFAPFIGELPESHAMSPEPWEDGRVYEDPAHAAAAAAAAEVQSARRQFLLRVVDEVVRMDSWEAEKAATGRVAGGGVDTSSSGGAEDRDGGNIGVGDSGGSVGAPGETEAAIGGVYGLAEALGLGSDDAVLRQHVSLSACACCRVRQGPDSPHALSLMSCAAGPEVVGTNYAVGN
jgi:hypothetical protein